MKNLLLTLLLISVSTIAFAEPEKKTLRFEVYIPPNLDEIQETTMMLSAKSNTDAMIFSNIDTEHLTKEVGYLTSLCSVIDRGQIKIWFRAGVKGGLLISASGEGGIEVTIHCQS
ncbi:MAG: hypothetical protein GKR77_06640 [Legionellales bacterium]|nr:hypothetical protein [Legionellales bacterium]